MFVVDLDRGVPVCRVVSRKSVFGDDATRAASTRVVLRRRLGFVRGAGGLRNRFTGARGTDAAPNISSVAAHRAEAVDGSMMGCQCYSTASVVGGIQVASTGSALRGVLLEYGDVDSTECS